MRRGPHDLGRKIGVDRRTVSDAEKGKPSTAVAVYAGLLWALGMIEPFGALADPSTDEEGKALALAREPTRARRTEALDNDF